MGALASYQLHCADKRMTKILVFVKCAYAGDAAKLQDMITKQKMSPNAQDRFGMTALHWGQRLCAPRRYVGSDYNVSGFGVAAYGGKLVCVQELLKAGASLAVLDDNGRSALHHACRKDHDDVVRFLVAERKMDVNALSESKDTPLHKAVCGKSIRTVELLLQLGADPSLRNDQNRTPLEELDADPRHVKDVVPEPLVTARMEVELSNWRQGFLTEVKSTGRTGPRRGSLETLLAPTSKLLGRRSSSKEPHYDLKPPSSTANGSSKKYASSTSVREVENTLVTDFRSRISEFSDRSSSRSSSAHFPTAGLWAKPPVDAGSVTGSSSTLSTARRDSATGKGVVVPLNLQGLGVSADGAASQMSSANSVASHGSDSASIRSQCEAPAHPSTTFRRRNLRYAGKRVIMALRVKKCMTGNEKRELIRLMLERHLKAIDGPDAVQLIGAQSDSPNQKATVAAHATDHSRELVREPSGFTISMPPNL